jgi:hypothetical protein
MLQNSLLNLHNSHIFRNIVNRKTTGLSLSIDTSSKEKRELNLDKKSPAFAGPKILNV